MQCTYAVLKRVVFAIDEDKIQRGEDVSTEFLERQISYFADEDGPNALLKHPDDSLWCQILKNFRDGFNEGNPRQPVSLWADVDADFKDLIGGLTYFDPAKRLTAHEALAGTWFAGI